MSIFQLPLSGNRFGFINIDLGKSTAEEIERLKNKRQGSLASTLRAQVPSPAATVPSDSA